MMEASIAQGETQLGKEFHRKPEGLGIWGGRRAENVSVMFGLAQTWDVPHFMATFLRKSYDYTVYMILYVYIYI